MGIPFAHIELTHQQGQLKTGSPPHQTWVCHLVLQCMQLPLPLPLHLPLELPLYLPLPLPLHFPSPLPLFHQITFTITTHWADSHAAGDGHLPLMLHAMCANYLHRRGRLQPEENEKPKF